MVNALIIFQEVQFNPPHSIDFMQNSLYKKSGVIISVISIIPFYNDKAITIIELQHEISNNVVCATSKASDQPAHTRSLIRAFARQLSIL